MFRSPTLLALLLTSLVFVSQACGDGIVIPQSLDTTVDNVSQEALINWVDGIETLVIQTRFTGESDEFAWIVPTPSEPEVSASTTGLFPTLRILTVPRVREGKRFWAGWVWVVVIIVGGIWLRCEHAAAVFVVLALFVLVLLPVLIVARLGSKPVVNPLVHQKGVIGDYEITVLSADDPSSLTTWLDNNGFKAPDKVNETLGAYQEDGWYFTAVRLKPGAHIGDLSTTHPLVFRFPTDEPVYPARLIASGSESTTVDLYVFGHQRARADGFDVAFCGRTAFPPAPTLDQWVEGWSGSAVPMWHPELLKRIGSSAFVTKLSAQFSADEMREDVSIRWDGEKTHIPRPWSKGSARVFAMNLAVAGAALTFLGLIFTIPRTRWGRGYLNLRRTLILIAGACAWVLVFDLLILLLPQTNVPSSRTRPILWKVAHGQLKTMAAVESIGKAPPPGEDDWLDDYVGTIKNPYNREDVRVGDEPGNFTYQWIEDRLIVTAYGPGGAPMRIEGK